MFHTRGHSSSNSFYVRVIDAWNNLPAEVNFSTINTFKRSIHYEIFQVFLTVFSVDSLTLCYLILGTIPFHLILAIVLFITPSLFARAVVSASLPDRSNV